MVSDHTGAGESRGCSAPHHPAGATRGRGCEPESGAPTSAMFGRGSSSHAAEYRTCRSISRMPRPRACVEQPNPTGIGASSSPYSHRRHRHGCNCLALGAYETTARSAIARAGGSRAYALGESSAPPVFGNVTRRNTPVAGPATSFRVAVGGSGMIPSPYVDDQEATIVRPCLQDDRDHRVIC
jgi:hypothetical protein